jgi:pseudouridine-5'-phosphate glycosidase
MLKTKWSLSLNGSVLIANPVPAAQEVSPELMEKYIQEALTEAHQQNITGKNVTPFLLKYIANHTKGESLDANIALIINNAGLGARIAAAMF